MCARPQPPSLLPAAKNPLSPLVPLLSVHSPATLLKSTLTQNIGVVPFPRYLHNLLNPITTNGLTARGAKQRQQFKYYLNCRHADISQPPAHIAVCTLHLTLCTLHFVPCTVFLLPARRSPLITRYSRQESRIAAHNSRLPPKCRIMGVDSKETAK